ncbi:MAG: Na/Pi symporter [Candidatus Zixiibacteriota bacterium]
MRLGGDQRLSGLVAAIKIVVLLYLFLLSIALLGTSFKAFGSGFAKQLVESTSNPFLGLMIGVIVTSLVQSSSVTTSLIVGLVGGGALSLQSAIPMVMGANIGTTVTNTLVSLGQIGRKSEFRRAFSAAVVHDTFNIITVIILFPIQVKFNLLGRAAEFLSNMFVGVSGAKFSSPIKVIVKPAAELVDSIVGGNPWMLIIIAAVLLFVSLNYLVKTLKSVVVSKIQVFFDKVIFKNAAISLVFGLVVTVMVQSSSITTSLVVPLAGAGLLNLWQVLPYTLGANVGTTVTAILASMATGEASAVAVAFAHLLFNVFGIIIIWPFRIVPIRVAEYAATLAVKNRMFPIAFVVVFFYAIPLGIVLLTR